MIVLFTDTDSDISCEKAQQLGFKLISLPYSIDGELLFPCESWRQFDDHAFYSKLRDGALPTTSSIGEEKYIEYFEPILRNGDDIFYVHFARNFSSTFVAMDQAIAKLKQKYPERKIWTVDTKAISIAELSIVEEVSTMFKAGKTPDEVIEWANDNVQHFALYFFTDGLKFLKRSGRISGLSGAMGTLLGIRPIVYLSDDGKLLNIGKEKGRFRAIERIGEYVAELGDSIAEHKIIVAASDNQELANEVKQMLEEKFGSDLPIEVMPIGPVIGSHCGPDAVGVTFYAKHR